jgi:hypothetical protein
MGIPERNVITDQLTYDTLWLSCNYPPVPGGKALTTQPPVDFSKEVVVEIYIGIRFSAGYSVTVTGLTPSGNGTIVHYQETVPHPDCTVDQINTWPFVVAAIEKPSGGVAFVKDPDREACP